MTSLDKKLLEIANKELFYFLNKPRASLDSFHNDTDDFITLAIWDIKSALESAYKLGLEDGRKETK